MFVPGYFFGFVHWLLLILCLFGFILFSPPQVEKDGVAAHKNPATLRVRWRLRSQLR